MIITMIIVLAGLYALSIYLLIRNGLIIGMLHRIMYEQLYPLIYTDNKEFRKGLNNIKKISYYYLLFGRIFTPVSKLELEINEKLFR